jgi:hypothetical protein
MARFCTTVPQIAASVWSESLLMIVPSTTISGCVPQSTDYWPRK